MWGYPFIYKKEYGLNHGSSRPKIINVICETFLY